MKLVCQSCFCTNKQIEGELPARLYCQSCNKVTVHRPKKKDDFISNFFAGLKKDGK